MFSDEAFIETLLIKANPDIEDSALDLLIEDVKPVLYDRFMTNLMAKFSEEKLQEFVDITKKHAAGQITDKDIQKFLYDEIPDYDDFVNKVYKEFETNYLEEFKNFEKDDEKEEK